MACPHLHRVVQEIKELGCKASVALNPHTSTDLLSEILPELDVVLVMSVNPGFGGQKFLPNTFEKVKRLKQLITESGTDCKIEVDGGVTREIAPDLVEAGADILVAGSFIFNSQVF